MQRNIAGFFLLKRMEKGFTPLEKSVDFNSQPSPFGANEGKKPQSEQAVRELYSLTGFTLIELIMTIVVVGLIAIPLAISLNAQVQGTVQSGFYTTALNLARLEMEKVNNLAYANINSTSYSSGDFDITRTVSYAQGNAGSAESLKQITVSVSRSGDAAVLASLTTYIAKNVTYA